MSFLPKSLENLIEALGALPGVGPRSAERYAYFLIKRDPNTSKKLANALSNLHEGIKTCPVTFMLIDSKKTISELYDDPKRDRTIVAVVADAFDVIALERTGLYHGTYHVLGGLISPIDGVGPNELHIPELIGRIKNDNVSEIILATNAGVEGQTTALYIQQQLGDMKTKVTRLAQGLSVGVDLEYADQLSLSRALEGRTQLTL